MINLPQDLDGKWVQPNTSDKFGVISKSRNINLDERGYVKLSPRMVAVMSSDVNGDFGLPVGIGRHSSDGYLAATSSNANFSGAISSTENTWTENSGDNEPTLTNDSHGCWFNGLWHASTDTAVLSRPATGGSAQAWTSRITGLTSGKRHYLASFDSLRTICVSNGNVVKQYDISYVDGNAEDLTITNDFEITGLVYNYGNLGVSTRPANDGTDGSDKEAVFYVWDGSGAGATGYKVGSDAILGQSAYLSSFVILTRNGRLLYFNGGGFDELAVLPIHRSGRNWQNPFTTDALGSIEIIPDGDVLHLNIPTVVGRFGRKKEINVHNFPSGVWSFSPESGLYHRLSPSISMAYVNHVSSGDVNTSTDTMTVSVNPQTIPATGGVARLTDTDGIGGLTENNDYYIIRVSDTEFKLATTKENALTGQAIDLTSATSGDSYFWMYDIVDYGSISQSSTGSLSKVGNGSIVYDDLVVGARCVDTAGSTLDLMCIAVPLLENRGAFVTPRISSSSVTDTNQKLPVRFRPLKDGDCIIVKSKTRDIVGLPVSTASDATWTSPREIYTTTDMSEAKTYLDAGGEIEMEVLTGAGAGTLVGVKEINTGSGTYSLVLEEDVIGAVSGRKSMFTLDNWKKLRAIGSSDSDITDGVVNIDIGGSSKFIMFKFELRGYETTIESFGFNSVIAKQN